MNGLTGVLVGALVTLIGVLVVYDQERRKRASEEERWYGQFFLQRKFDALTRLHEALVDCRFAFSAAEFPEGEPGVNPTSRFVDWYQNKLQSRQDALVRARVVASIYLTSDENNQIGLAVDGFFAVFDGIRARMRNPEAPEQFMWLTVEEGQKFMDGFRPAAQCLKQILAPRFPGITASTTGTK